MSAASTSKREQLVARATMLHRVRQFFRKRAVLEVDAPMLSHGAAIDFHIDPIEARCMQQSCFLHTSPEHALKRLLSDGVGDIFFLGHVFRDEECSPLHQPEFTMVEWYRLGFSFQEMIDETVDLVELFLGPQCPKQMTYRDAFLKYAQIDLIQDSDRDLLDRINKEDRLGYAGIEREGRDALCNLLLALVVQPAFAKEPCFVLTHYPATQAALSKTSHHQGLEVALRFELFVHGIELGNGYHELTDADEQRDRLEKGNIERLQAGKSTLPIDHHLLGALQKGMPDCCGVAVGFDRLLMLQLGAPNIAQLLPFGWQEI